jgi:Uncharacterized conserved protein (DUF2190)
MSQYVDSNVKAFTSAGTIAQYARVTLGSGGTITEAGLAVKEIGTAMQAAVSGDVVPVRLRTAAGTHKMIAKEAIAAGALLYTEAGGKVQDTAETSAFQVGHALEAATADNDIIEVLYNAHGDTAAS